MSKRDDDQSADMEVGMTTAERRWRRKRATVRVPSDNVPRRPPTLPPPMAPVPEDPALAMSIAYAFTRDASDLVPRVDDFEPLPAASSDRAPTTIDVPADGASGAGGEDFESKTREMAAVDLEALGLSESDLKSAASSAAIAVTAASSMNDEPSVIIADDVPDATADVVADESVPVTAAPAAAAPIASAANTNGASAREAKTAVYAALEDVRVSTDPAIPIDAADQIPVPAVSTGNDDLDVEVEMEMSTSSEPEPEAVDGEAIESSSPADSGEAIEMVADSSPELPRATAESESEASSPAIALSDYDIETTNVVAVPVAGSPVAAAPVAAAPVAAAPVAAAPVAAAADTGRPRFKTVALSEADLEEVLEAARAASQLERDPNAPAPGLAPVAAHAGAHTAPVAEASAVPSATEGASLTVPLSERDVEMTHENTGEIEVNLDEAGNLRAPAAHVPPLPPAAQSAAGVAQSAPPPVPPRAPPTPPPQKKAPTPPPVAAVAPPGPNRDKPARGKPWFAELFDEDYLRTLPFLTAQATQAEAEFVIDAMGLAPGAQLLDVGCGYGRHAMELAARGYHVVGLDLSTPLLVRGGEEAHRRGLTINFVRGDVRELDFDSQFDGAYCLMSTFGYFDDETNKRALSNIARALRPGGRVLIEILNRDYLITDLPTRVWWEGDGCVVLEEVELNYFSSRIAVNRSVVFDDGRQLEQEISIRAYSLHEVGKLMHAAGFRVLEVSGGYHTRGRFFGNQSRHIIVLAERKDAAAAS